MLLKRAIRQNVLMAKKKRGRPHFIRDWRKSRGLSLEQLAELINMTHGTLSRIERCKTAYTQPVLEALAEALGCQPWDLIWRPPGAVDKLREVLEGLDPDVQKRALAVVQALRDSEKAA